MRNMRFCDSLDNYRCRYSGSAGCGLDETVCNNQENQYGRIRISRKHGGD